MTALLSAKLLTKQFPVRRSGLLPGLLRSLTAVDKVSLDVERGETLGLVGESGCGKSTIGRMLLRLIEPTAGEIWFDGMNILELAPSVMRSLRRQMQIVFQDPYGALNPRMTVEQIVKDPIIVNSDLRGVAMRDRVSELLERVGLAAAHRTRYPHEFSGGQRQRIGIARALALNPRFIVCDEPVSALDVSVQAQIINLLQDLQDEYGLSYLFISHDLGVVKHISHRVAVMYLGQLVELAPKSDLFARPLHPYTQALIAAIPEPNLVAGHVQGAVRGEIPSALDPPKGCRFHTRCPHAMAICRVDEPISTEQGAGHQVSCHLFPVA